jgi:hypothetical protein
MVLGSVATARSLASHVSSEEMDDDEVTDYLEKGTSFVENETKILEADWADNVDLQLAVSAAECFAAAYMVLTVSTAKESTARFNELLRAAQKCIDSILKGEPGQETSAYFVSETSDYKTYENNPDNVEPYESTL